jgi:hypothetical protein
LLRRGVDPGILQDVSRALEADTATAALESGMQGWLRRLVADDTMEALTAVAAFVCIARTKSGDLATNAARRAELRRALQGNFLKEFTDLFSKVVGRAATFDCLSYSDSQIREASRCYLYGFFRAAVLTACAAVEGRLKSLAPVKLGKSYYARLVDASFGAFGAAGHDAVRVAALGRMFALRNDIAHRGNEPTAEEATGALDLARGTLESLENRRP